MSSIHRKAMVQNYCGTDAEPGDIFVLSDANDNFPWINIRTGHCWDLPEVASKKRCPEWDFANNCRYIPPLDVKVGSVVALRDGRRGMVVYVSTEGDETWPIRVATWSPHVADEDPECFWVSPQGQEYSSGEHPGDIVEVLI